MSFTQAWAEAQATPNSDTVEIYSLELLHSAFIQNGQVVSVRAVNQPGDMMLPLEVGAPLNPGQTVLFTGIPFEVPWFESEEQKVPELVIKIDNIGREVMPYLDAAILVNESITVIFRCHLWSRAAYAVTGTGFDPVSFELKSVSVTDEFVQGTANPADIANLQYLRVIYDIANYGGLTQG